MFAEETGGFLGDLAGMIDCEENFFHISCGMIAWVLAFRQVPAGRIKKWSKRECAGLSDSF
ncbi:hypothetical protein JYP51_09180 [Ponticoccus gilvus]|nr:hypothetical protein [Enemella evansiae]